MNLVTASRGPSATADLFVTSATLC